jgi:hypothetical protein
MERLRSEEKWKNQIYWYGCLTIRFETGAFDAAQPQRLPDGRNGEAKSCCEGIGKACLSSGLFW